MTGSKNETRRAGPQLILASASPRRKQLLTRLGYPFRVEISGVSEKTAGGLGFAEEARILSKRKAAEVSQRFPDRIILSADTVVVLRNRSLGKPASPEEAFTMLVSLRGDWHRVVTAFCIVAPGRSLPVVEAVESQVLMREYSEAEIESYVSTGEPLDKAGSYAIQGQGSRLVNCFKGCFNNIVGLPICRVARALSPFLELPDEPTPVCRLPDGSACPLS